MEIVMGWLRNAGAFIMAQNDDSRTWIGAES